MALKGPLQENIGRAPCMVGPLTASTQNSHGEVCHLGNATGAENRERDVIGPLCGIAFPPTPVDYSVGMDAYVYKLRFRDQTLRDW